MGRGIAQQIDAMLYVAKYCLSARQSDLLQINWLRRSTATIWPTVSHSGTIGDIIRMKFG